MRGINSLRLHIPLAIIRGAFRSTTLPRPSTQILASRNDGYGVQPIERLLLTIAWNQRWLGCDTIFVEWNPPNDVPLLSEMLVKHFQKLRCYVVPPSIHEEIAGKTGHPFQEFHAKNVGIRRAAADWIAPMNNDILVAPDCRCIPFRPKQLDILRTRRVDFPFCGKRVSLYSVLDGRKFLRFRTIDSDDASAPGDFTLASRELWHMARGYDEEQINRRVLCDCRGILQLVALGGTVKWIGTHFHLDHPESTSLGVRLEYHGDLFEDRAGIPYRNPTDWGLGNLQEQQTHERIWVLQ